MKRVGWYLFAIVLGLGVAGCDNFYGQGDGVGPGDGEKESRNFVGDWLLLETVDSERADLPVCLTFTNRAMTIAQSGSLLTITDSVGVHDGVCNPGTGMIAWDSNDDRGFKVSFQGQMDSRTDSLMSGTGTAYGFNPICTFTWSAELIRR